MSLSRTLKLSMLVTGAVAVLLLASMATCSSTAASPSLAERDRGATAVPQLTPTAAPARPVRPLPPARQPGTLYNGAFAEQVDSAPSGWTAFGPGARVETTAGGAIAARVVVGPAGINWLAQTVRIQGGTAFEVRARASGDARAVVRVSWHVTDDGSGNALGFVEARPAAGVPTDGEPLPMSTGPFVTDAKARSLRVRLVAEGATGSSALFADGALTGVPISAVVAPAPTPPAVATSAAAGIAVTPVQSASAAEPPPAPARPEAVASPSGPPARAEAHAAAAPESVVPMPPVLVEAAATPQATALRPQTPIVPMLKINEVGFGKRGAAWAELYNAGNAAVALDGWSIAGERLPAMVVPGHGYAVVAAGASFLEDFPRFSSVLVLLAGGQAGELHRDAGRLELSEPSGALVDAVSWGTDSGAFRDPLPTIAPGHSLERRIAGLDRDLREDFVDNARPTPGEGYASDAASSRLPASLRATLLGAALAVPLTLVMAAGATLARRRLASKA